MRRASILAALLLAGCGGGEPAATSTSPAPTPVGAEAVAALATPAPVATPAPTPAVVATPAPVAGASISALPDPATMPRSGKTNQDTAMSTRTTRARRYVAIDRRRSHTG